MLEQVSIFSVFLQGVAGEQKWNQRGQVKRVTFIMTEGKRKNASNLIKI